jgi:MFS family permease
MTERKSGSRKPRSPEKQPAASDQPSFGIEQPEKRPSVALVVAVVLTAILEVLDITIVSVAIPHMLGSFGATSDQITWVLTSYLVSAAVVMPLTGISRRGWDAGGCLTFQLSVSLFPRACADFLGISSAW